MQQYKKILGKVMMTAEGTYNKDKEYEPISLVTDEETNKSYISRKEVPAGTQINNREYWQPVASSGIIDNGVIILNRKNSDGQIPIYDLKSAAEAVAVVDRKGGVILGFLGFNPEIDTVPTWKLYQYNDVSSSNWTNIDYWLPMDYTNKYAGWFDNEEALYDSVPFPKVGMYAYIGNSATSAIIYRCYVDKTWQATEDKAFGGVVNLADEEDITSKQNKLKFKDKEYNPAQFSGLGKLYLRKNVVDGKNVLTQTMMQATNTIYIIQYDYDLQGEAITIPENCVLDFQGGTILNGKITGTLLNEYFRPEWFGAKGDGNNDDTIAINYATGLGIVRLTTNKIYRTTSSIFAKNNIEGQNARIFASGSYNIIEVENDTIIKDLEIYSVGTSTGNGSYGINIKGNNNTVENCYIHDITYSAIMCIGGYNVINNVRAYNCGWDLASNYGEASINNKWINCTAKNCQRHGFSTDPGSKYIEFINCSAIDIGSTYLNEGHTCYHFEGSYAGKVINCNAFYTENFNSSVGECIALRMETANASSDKCIVDNFRLKIDNENGQTIRAILANGSLESTICNSTFELGDNNSIIYIGNCTINLDNCRFIGPISYTQYGLASKLNIYNSYFSANGGTFFTSTYGTTGIRVENNVFNGFSTVFTGRFVNSVFKNNVFQNIVGTAIRLNNDTTNANNKSTNNIISYNTFRTVGTCIRTGWWDGTLYNRAEHNLFTGTIGIGINAGEYGQIYLEGNYTDGESSITTPTNNPSGRADFNTLNASMKGDYDYYIKGSVGSTRPTIHSSKAGYCLFDTSLGKPIWWTGSKWVDSTGATV